MRKPRSPGGGRKPGSIFPLPHEDTMTTLKLSGGDLGDEVMLVRCDLSQASSPIEVDYCNDGPKEYGKHWESSQYQCADTSHTLKGLIRIGEELAARAVEMAWDDFVCDSEEVTAPYYGREMTIKVMDYGSDSWEMSGIYGNLIDDAEAEVGYNAESYEVYRDVLSVFQDEFIEAVHELNPNAKIKLAYQQSRGIGCIVQNCFNDEAEELADKALDMAYERCKERAIKSVRYEQKAQAEYEADLAEQDD